MNVAKTNPTRPIRQTKQKLLRIFHFIYLTLSKMITCFQKYCFQLTYCISGFAFDFISMFRTVDNFKSSIAYNFIRSKNICSIFKVKDNFTDLKKISKQLMDHIIIIHLFQKGWEFFSTNISESEIFLFKTIGLAQRYRKYIIQKYKDAKLDKKERFFDF